jgi:perosamine synthetase
MHPASNRVESLLRDRIGVAGPVPLHSPQFDNSDWAPVKDCIDTGWVSSVGSYVSRFEEMVASASGTGFAVATVNGTAALHAALIGLGVQGGDLVICPALTFVGTANAISMCGAEPIFIDSDTETLGLSVPELSRFLSENCTRTNGLVEHRDTGKRVAAIIPVHLFGHPVDMDGLVSVVTEHGLPVIEDAAEALGSTYHGRPCGSLGHAAILSFNGNKIITTGGGGMIVTDDEQLAIRLKHLTTTARIGTSWEFDHDMVGYNYRLPNLNAALGCAQMEKLDQYISQKRKLASLYADTFNEVPEVTFVRERPGVHANYWLNAILVDGRETRDQILQETNDRDIMTRPCWRLLPDTPAYGNAPVCGAFDGARLIADRLINLPSSAWLVENVRR